MPKFLTASRLRSSIKALSDTRGKANLLDFLIVKRTLALKGTKQVAITQGEPKYIQATRELAGVQNKPVIDVKAQQEIFNVFASQDSKGGFRTGKYISNGTGSTISNNPWQTVIELTSDSPREARFRAGYEDGLADLLLKEGPQLGRPVLGEVAVWNYRFTDLDSTIGSETNPTKRGKLLEARLRAEYKLTAKEMATLFEVRDVEITNQDLGPSPADPVTYIPGLKTPSAAFVPFLQGELCSLDLVTALAAKPFVILSGTSGTGKSRAILRLAEELQQLYAGTVNQQIFRLVPIGPDWTSPKRLLGYRTPFGQARKRADGSETNESYDVTETLRVILRGCHPTSNKVPHFLVFDEMNLSHVERYFAPFLSLMEASSILEDGENAPIVDRQSLIVISEILDLEDKTSVEAESARLLVTNDQPLKLPPNLFYVGTINVDETTYMFSPKVLDRAHVLEVRALTPSQYVTGANPEKSIDVEQANSLFREAIDARETGESARASPGEILDLLSSKHGILAADLAGAKALTLKVLDGCFHLLAPPGFEFAYRVVKEIYVYMLVWIKAQLEMGVTPQQAMQTWVSGLDRAVFQKVLPKIHGNRSTLGDSLIALAAFLEGANGLSNPPAKYTLGVNAVIQIETQEAIVLPPGSSFQLCCEKLRSMHERLVTRNYVSFVK
jgi:hypothetical protein